jgi:hypothetical protein
MTSDDTTPAKEPVTRLCRGQDTTGNEDSSIFRGLANFFSNSCYGELSGFYTQGYPASSKHMFWHVKCRGTNEPHREPWHTDSERQLMESYIARHKDEYPLWLLEEHRKETPYSCPDPCLHIRERENVDRQSSEAEKRLKEDFETLESFVTDYTEHRGRIPYCVILQCLAARYLGAGKLDPEFANKELPYRSSLQISGCLGTWESGVGLLGIWRRFRSSQCPLPEKLQKFEPRVDYEIDRGHEKIGDKPQFNNYFINVVKNLGAHVFMYYD